MSLVCFFFKQKTAYEVRICDWSSDVCPSDLSAAGVVGVPMHGEYVGAKHAVVGLTRVAAADYGKHGIRVNALVPGAVRTPMLQRAMDNDAGLEPYLNSIHPIGRFSEPHEQAQAAVWLLSDAASFVTGSCLAADGGFTAI